MQPLKAALCLALLILPSICSQAINKGKVNYAAIREVEAAYPGMGKIVWAIRLHENGSCNFECGNYGKTRFAQRYPVEQRQYIEAARSVSRFTLEYAKRPIGDYWEWLGSRYLNSTKARNHEWAKSVRAIYHKLKANHGRS